MKINLRSLGRTALFVGVFLAPVGVGRAAPPVQAQPAPTLKPAAAPRPAMKRVTKTTVQATAAVPGETRNVKAVLTTGSTPLVGKRIAFRFEGKQPNGQDVAFDIGSDATDERGEASVAWKVPELGQGPYRLKARFAGDDDTGASADDANFGIVKGITRFELGNVVYGALDSHGGPKFHTVIVRLRRQADNEALGKTVKVRINNGPVQTVNLGQYGASMSTLLLQPTDANQWTLKAEFAGDDANQATSAERTYSRAPGS